MRNKKSRYIKRFAIGMIAMALIVVGIAVASYPLAERMYTSYMQERILQEFAAEYHNLQPLFEENIREEQNHEHGDANEEALIENSEDTQGQADDVVEQTTEQVKASLPPKPIDPLGVLTIDRINLTLPIFQGATNSHLKIGAGLITGTAAIGETGNTALAAHRSYTYGRFFNRLDELQIGDKIIIDTGHSTLQYHIYDKKIVEPDDVSVLAGNQVDSILTLVTCDPIETGTHRLIVHAILE